MVLETAVNGHADALVTFNVRDFGTIPQRFGVGVMIPSEAIRRVRNDIPFAVATFSEESGGTTEQGRQDEHKSGFQGL
jgi:hypothetical protein